MQLQGKLIVKKDEQKASDSFTKREIVIETDEQFSQQIQLELHQNNVDLIDAINIGETIKCSINVRGKKYTTPEGEDKYFNTLVCWRVERV